VENKKLLPSIVALLAIAMAAISVTSVMTPSIVSAAALSTATLAPDNVRANTRVKFTVTVTNNDTENIDNVKIVGIGFTQPIGYAENLVMAADNIENAVAPLKQAGENLRLAEDNKENDAAQALSGAATDLQAAADALALLSPGWENNVASQMGDAATYLTYAADNLAASSENFTLIALLLDNVATELHGAAGNAVAGENMMAYDSAAAENLDNAAARFADVATALRNGTLRRAGENLKIAGDNFENASTTLTSTASATVGTKMSAAGSSLLIAYQALIDAANYLDNAGYALGMCENYLTSAGTRLSTVTNLTTAGNNLENGVARMLEAAENQLRANPENLFAAGENLKIVADNLENVAVELGVALGQDNENAAATDIDQAADNLRTAGTVDMTTAGDELISAGENLADAASTMESTAADLQPTTWTVSSETNAARFDAIGDNIIAPGATETFVFLWTTPNITTETDYMISVLISWEEAVYTTYENLGGFIVTVDGRTPTLIIQVTQVGVVDRDGNPIVNVVGMALDNALATITIEASEELQSLGTVTVENSGNDENFIPPVTMTKTDTTTYTGTFTVENWDDNVVAVRVASAKDAAGNENTAGMENTITVDTRPPVFLDNGLAVLISGVRENVYKAGTTTVYTYVDNFDKENMIIRVEDNIANADNGAWISSVTVDTTAATDDPTLENRWTLEMALNEGLNSMVKVTATDRAGNTVSDNIENIFVDTQPPTIAFNTVSGNTWDENGELTNENKPRIKITVLDPGYAACTGLGVARENLRVYLDNDDNLLNALPAWGGLLENADNWDVATGVFENIVDNLSQLCRGLVDGTYWIHVAANDNLKRAMDNENYVLASRSFVIDTALPTFSCAANVTGWTAVVDVTQNTDSLTISGSGLLSEAGGTITVWQWGSFTSLATATVDDLGYFSVEVTFPADGVYQLWISLTDLSGNESTKALYGTVTVDTAAPVLTVSAIAESTDQATVLVSGTCDDENATVTINATGMDAQTLTLTATGAFSYAVPLVEGTNTITITATDTAGNDTSETLTIERSVTAWATYAVILVIVALILAAIAIFKKR
jgi:hypothetical protein